jgi:transcriptional regulator with GAF, ATPase, and Fis domain/CHASE2 domain-containing sensor protein
MNNRTILASAFLVGVALTLVVLQAPLEGFEDQLLAARYQLRGPVPADTNIVILYFDNDDIASLGGWPLTRNYYALLIDVLSKSEVASIGFDIVFGEHNLQFPEHDHLLALTAKNAGCVVLATYFRSLNGSVESNEEVPPPFAYLPKSDGAMVGSGLQLPYPELERAAAGLGHAHVPDRPTGSVAPMINFQDRGVPALAIEVLRVARKLERSSVTWDGSVLRMRGNERDVTIPVDSEGRVLLNYTGPLQSFTRYRAVEVLRSFEHQRMGLQPSPLLSSLKGKMILVGIIGEGRSVFVPSPFDDRIPSVGVHATFIDNAVNDRFLRSVGGAGMLAISLALVAVSLLLLRRYGYLSSIIGTLVLLVVYSLGAHLLFVYALVIVPIAAPLIAYLISMAGIVFYESRKAQRKVGQLESDKERIESELRSRELKLQLLERELLDERAAGDPDVRGIELTNEIRKYKEEIRSLSAKVSDLVRFELPAAAQEDGKAEFEGLIYESAGKMSAVVELIRKIAASNANVLILGESGTGKELVARAIHNLSTRRNGQFVAVNCGALTETLLESELFGHERGAFTGAIKEKIGRFEYANGGTIFLDEIAETSEAFQVKLLRVVQSGEFERVGSTVTLRTDARIIAATNKNLAELIAQKKFREDLYYRLNIFTVQLPSLRERKGDIPILAEYFLKKEDPGCALSATVVDALLQYEWPGNVRELEGSMKRAAILARSENRTLIQLKDLPEQISATLKGKVDIEDQILETLRAKRFSRSSISETAEELGGLNRGTVAEYFRGICFRYFFESSWDLARAAVAISESTDSEVHDRVSKKLQEYLKNVVDGLRVGTPFDELKPTLRAKYKNLPQRYHMILDEVIRAYLDGKWTPQP